MSQLVAVRVCQTGEVREVAASTIAIIVGIVADEDAGRVARVPYLDTDIVVSDLDDTDKVEELLAIQCDVSFTFVGDMNDWRESDADRVAYVAFPTGGIDTRWQACTLAGETR